MKSCSPDFSGYGKIFYEYDALGRRTKRNVQFGATTKFSYDGLDVIKDDDTVSGITKYQNGLGIDNKLKLTNGGTSKYFLQDHLGSTVGLTDTSGNLTEETAYDTFGNATNPLSTRYQFTGREFDSFSGLHHYRARWYDSQIGRFISEDPIGFAGGDVNLFGYVWNNPTNFIDRNGNIGLPFIGTFLKPKPEKCDEACQRDKAKIYNTFDGVVSEMNAKEERHWLYPVNGLQGTWAMIFGGEPYLSCYEQSEKLKNRLNNDVYENNWNFDFEQSTIPGTDWHPHTWVKGNSTSPNTPNLTLDPWKNQKGGGLLPLL